MTLSTRLILALSIAPFVVAQTQFSTDVLVLSPLGFWPLNGNASDASTHGNNGTLMNGVTFTSVFPPPVEAQAAVFDRSQSQFVLMPTAGSTIFNLGSLHAFTAMAWVKTLGLRHMAIVGKGDANSGWAFGIDSKAGLFSLLFLVGGQLALGVESTVAVNDGRWHLIAVTYDGSGAAGGVRMYVDGLGVGSTVAANTLGNGSILNSAPLTVGGGSDGSDAFEGNMNDVAVFGAALTPAQILQLAGDALASKAILGQFAFGGGWYSAIYFSNTGTSSVSFPVSFTGDNGLPLNVPSISGSSTTVTLGPGASAVIEALNAGPLNQGYVSMVLPIGVTGYGVFRQSVPGATDQEAVVPLSYPGALNQTLVYDDTNAATTAVAIVNPSSISTTITITVEDTNGHVIGTSSPPVVLQPFSKTEAVLRSIPGLSGMANNRGIANFSVSSGSVVVLGLRAKGLALTSIPAVNSRQLSLFTGEPFF